MVDGSSSKIWTKLPSRADLNWTSYQAGRSALDCAHAGERTRAHTGSRAYLLREVVRSVGRRNTRAASGPWHIVGAGAGVGRDTEPPWVEDCGAKIRVSRLNVTFARREHVQDEVTAATSAAAAPMTANVTDWAYEVPLGQAQGVGDRSEHLGRCCANVPAARITAAAALESFITTIDRGQVILELGGREEARYKV